VDINVGGDILGLFDQRSSRHNGFYSQWLWSRVVVVVLVVVAVVVVVVGIVVLP
jgi:hypothetical protein